MNLLQQSAVCLVPGLAVISINETVVKEVTCAWAGEIHNANKPTDEIKRGQKISNHAYQITRTGWRLGRGSPRWSNIQTATRYTWLLMYKIQVDKGISTWVQYTITSSTQHDVKIKESWRTITDTKKTHRLRWTTRRARHWRRCSWARCSGTPRWDICSRWWRWW